MVKMDRTIEKSLQTALTYQEYRDLVSDLLANGKSTGNTQTESYLEYSKLGNARMRRLDKTFKLSEKDKSQIKNNSKSLRWVVLTEGWCGDAGHALPVMNKIAAESDNIELDIVLRDDNDELMNKFLTNGNKSIPKLIVLDNATNEVINTWGPRPSIATQMVNDYKEENGSLDPEFKKDLQIWYNKNKGQNILSDLLNLIV